tara:strand:+ start:1521 stop:2018 length:498 start_codon:yes stop_codon:yes gene_type:complete
MATYTDYNPSKCNDFISPPYIWKDIIKYIPKNKVISMPFYCDGECGKDMQKLGFDVEHKDEDFFENDRGDIVIDNPPFEFKKKVIETLVERNKPFIIIVPVSTICYGYTKVLKDIQILIPNKRLKFIHYDKEKRERKKDWEKHSPAFDCVYLCWKMELEKDIIFL